MNDVTTKTRAKPKRGDASDSGAPLGSRLSRIDGPAKITGAARYALEQHAFSHFPGMEPFGNYPIQIIVKNGRILLLGIVNNDADKTIVEVRARQVTGVFGVDNDLAVSKK